MTDPFVMLLAVIPFGALAGYAALLRSDDELSSRAIAAAVTNSAILAGVIYLMLHQASPESIYINVAMAVLSGLGGNTSLGIALKIWQAVVEATRKP